MNSSTDQSQSRRWPPAIGPDIHDAMQYVSRVRQRFANDPDKYQQFLGILQTYRQNSYAGPLENVQMYMQMQELFKDAPDLFAEFRECFSPTM